MYKTLIRLKKNLKKLFQFFIKHPSAEQKRIFEQAQPGDIIFCAMPLPQTELKKIEESHRQRPYVVIRKNPSSLTCFYCSSKDKKSEHQFPISPNRYQVWKNGYVYTNKIVEIPMNKIIRKLDSLSAEYMVEIQRDLMIQRADRKNVITFKFPITFHKGDLIRNAKKYYYIYSIDKETAYCFRVIATDIDDSYPLEWHRHTFFVDVHAKEIIRPYDGYALLHHYDDGYDRELHQHIYTLQPPKKPKSHFDPEHHHYLRYDIGQVMYDDITDTDYIYLFSYQNLDYFAYYTEPQEEDDYPACNIKAFNALKRNYSIKKVASDDEITDVIYDAIAANPAYQWYGNAYLS